MFYPFRWKTVTLLWDSIKKPIPRRIISQRIGLLMQHIYLMFSPCRTNYCMIVNQINIATPLNVFPVCVPVIYVKYIMTYSISLNTLFTISPGNLRLHISRLKSYDKIFSNSILIIDTRSTILSPKTVYMRSLLSRSWSLLRMNDNIYHLTCLL